MTFKGKFLLACLLLLFLLPALIAAAGGSNSDEKVHFFHFQKHRFKLTVFPAHNGWGFVCTGAGFYSDNTALEAFNFPPRLIKVPGNLWLMWLQHNNGTYSLHKHDFLSKEKKRIVFENFSYVGFPEVIAESGRLEALVFIAKRAGNTNNDIYTLNPASGEWRQLTTTPRSEKNLSVVPGQGGYTVKSATLDGEFLYFLDRFDLESGNPALRLQQFQPRISSQASPKAVPINPVNTMITFGDSITWGKMRMDDLDGDYHPELAYSELLANSIRENVGPFAYFNASTPSDSTLDGAQRIDTILTSLSAKFLLIMLGTNDTWEETFSLESSIENLAFIIDRGLSDQLNVIISTIPPRKDWLGNFKFVQQNIKRLNADILVLAETRGIHSIDTYQTFIDNDPPDGWQILLEDTGGNHPSPAGHQVIASLFYDSLLAFPPDTPLNPRVTPVTEFSVTLEWDLNLEIDFSHYLLEFGYAPDRIPFKKQVTGNQFTVSKFPLHDPFYDTIYFRLQSVDLAGNKSPFSTIVSSGFNPVSANSHQKKNHNISSEAGLDLIIIK